MNKVQHWFSSGSPWIWFSGAGLSLALLMVIGLLGLIGFKGLVYFWPGDIYQFQYQFDGKQETIAGEIYERESVPVSQLKAAGIQLDTQLESVERILVKTGNRDVLGVDFRWLLVPNISQQQTPESLVVIERREWGNFYGSYLQLLEQGKVVAEGEAAVAQALPERLQRVQQLHDQITDIERHQIGSLNYQLERLRLKQRSLELKQQLTAEATQQLDAERQQVQQQYTGYMDQLDQLKQQISRDQLLMSTADSRQKLIDLSKVVAIYRPNELSAWGKTGLYLAKLWEFVADEPREANTEGGIFPAIFGTVLMVLMMSVIVTPLGVMAAVYLREYAKQGLVTRLIRISVINLAGVPSIVFGVFGLGFFVYFLGGSIDSLFYPEAQPSPTFGTPGLLWSSLTLALLTVPVVIVSTEEGLARIPRAVREGSLALGATKAETLWRIVLPMASPAMMTGLVLAIARAAGEVAPLMLVGVVKLAPTLPLDGNAPFLHLERKFMHLGFHIYDVGFQSPNVEAARPLVFATALLLVLVIVFLNLAAISIRNRLREKYRSLES